MQKTYFTMEFIQCNENYFSETEKSIKA